MLRNKYVHKTVLSTFLLFGAMAPNIGYAQSSQKEFSDVNTNYSSYEAITNLSKRGIINGYLDGTFRPFEKITRAHVAKLIAEMLELDLTNVDNPNFKDVPVNHPYYAHIAALENANIISGYGDLTFGPNNHLKRSQIAKIISEAFDLEQKTLVHQSFKDVKQSDYYAKYLQSMIDLKITVGTTETTYGPNEFVKRKQLADFLYRSDSAVNGTYNLAVISEISNNKVMTNEGSFEIANDLIGLFDEKNQEALKDAYIEFRTKNSKISSLEFLVFNNSGTDLKPVVFDGGLNTVVGNVVINSDNIQLTNLVIGKDLILSDQVKNAFHGKDLTVLGETSVKGTSQSAKLTSLSALGKLVVGLDNVTMNKLSLGITDMQMNFLNNCSVEQMDIQQNATVSGSELTKINNVNITNVASNVQLNANVTNLNLNATVPTNLSGSANITNLMINTIENIALNTIGLIKNMNIVSNVKLELGTNTKIENIALPIGKELSNIINNYEGIKENIDNVNGVKNPVTPPPTSGGGGTPIDSTPPVLESASLVIGGSTVVANKITNNDWQVTLSIDLRDTDMFTGITLIASETGTANITFLNTPKQRSFNANGELTLNVSEILGDLDPQQDGVSVQKLKELVRENNGEIIATLRDSAGNPTFIKITIDIQEVIFLPPSNPVSR